MSENVVFKIKYVNTKERNVMPYLNYLKLGGKDGIQNKQKEIDGYVGYMTDRKGSEHILRTEKGIDAIDIINDLKQHKGLVWLPIISLREGDAINYGCTTSEHWQSCVDEYVNEFCKAYNLTRNNVEYIYCKHEKSVITSDKAQKQPHVHLCIFQKQENCTKATISKDRLKILHDKTDRIFMKNHYKKLYEKRNTLANNLKLAFTYEKDSDLTTLQEIKLLVLDITGGVGRNTYNHVGKLKSSLLAIQEKQNQNIELNSYESKLLNKHEIINIETIINDIDYLQVSVNDYVDKILNKPYVKTIFEEWEEISTIIKDSRLNYNTNESLKKDRENLRTILINQILKTNIDELKANIQIDKKIGNIFDSNINEKLFESTSDDLVATLSSVALALQLSYSDAFSRITSLINASSLEVDLQKVKSTVQNVYRGNTKYVSKEVFTKTIKLLKTNYEYPYFISKPYLNKTYKKIISFIPRTVLDNPNRPQVTIADIECELEKEVEVVYNSKFK